MKAFSVDVDGSVNEIEVQMQANTTYTFFGSILIDEHESINEHMMYSDANALSEKKEAYFIGEQLIIGKALMVGREGFTDLDVKISKEALESLIQTDLSDFYKSALAELSTTDVNLYRTFLVSKGSESVPLNAEWVLYTFNIADDRTKEYFLSELKKALNAKENAETFLQKMAGLALNAGA